MRSPMGHDSAAHPLDLDAAALLHLVRGRKLSCVDLMAATLDHIDALNPTFNAIVALRPRDDLLREARQRDAAPAGGVLFGLPMAIKDLAAAKGVPMTMGSPLLENFIPPEDSIYVERLRRAGAIVAAKTNTPEFEIGRAHV